MSTSGNLSWPFISPIVKTWPMIWLHAQGVLWDHYWGAWPTSS